MCQCQHHAAKPVFVLLWISILLFLGRMNLHEQFIKIWDCGYTFVMALFWNQENDEKWRDRVTHVYKYMLITEREIGRKIHACKKIIKISYQSFKPAHPSLFGTRDRFSWKTVIPQARVRGVVSGWYKHIPVTVRFIIIVSAPPQIISH